ncbi:hypothetical protein DFJ74DRAFT_649955 [Hyaloraphidium curvatum]|nr:hypothetical protein DFJ74DRAFT_649955 [Hyaloraphidium curvatum]
MGTAGDLAPPRWMVWWFAIATPLAIWDTMFLLLRPHTYEGTFLGSTLYKAYNDLYVKMDLSYSRPVYEEGDTAHGLATVIAISQWTTDIPLQALCLLWWRSPATQARGTLLALVLSMGVFVRTCVFVGTDIFGNFCSTRNGEPWMKALYYFSNGLWLVFSVAIMAYLWPKVAARIDGSSAVAANGKKAR